MKLPNKPNDKPVKDESLRISDYIRSQSRSYFKGRTYFRSHMEKLVWEEDD